MLFIVIAQYSVVCTIAVLNLQKKTNPVQSFGNRKRSFFILILHRKINVKKWDPFLFTTKEIQKE